MAERGWTFTEKVVEIYKSRPVVVALFLVFATFCFWLAAMVSPGWLIFRLETTKTPLVHEFDTFEYSEYSELGTTSLVRTETIKYSIEMGIFYWKVCKSGECVKINYKRLKRISRETVDSIPELSEIKSESISALRLSVLGFLFLLFNFGKSSRVVTGGSAMLLAALAESILVLRMIIANIETDDAIDSIRSTLDSENISMKLDVPYSVILACIGIIFSVLVIWFCRVLYLRLGQENTDGQVLNLFPISFPIHFTLLRERD